MGAKCASRLGAASWSQSATSTTEKNLQGSKAASRANKASTIPGSSYRLWRLPTLIINALIFLHCKATPIAAEALRGSEFFASGSTFGRGTGSAGYRTPTTPTPTTPATTVAADSAPSTASPVSTPREQSATTDSPAANSPVQASIQPAITDPSSATSPSSASTQPTTANLAGTNAVAQSASSAATSTVAPSAAPTVASSLNRPASLSLSFQPSMDNFTNPERGFFAYIDLGVNGSAFTVRKKGYSLGYAVHDLSDFRDGSDISATYLANLTATYAQARAASIKLISRFVYNYQADGQDAPKAVVLRHIQQLGPVLSANADAIAILEAGFVGAWGEWHDSTSNVTSSTDLQAIVNAELAVLPTTRSVCIRYPEFKRSWFAAPLNKSMGLTGSAAARIGYHNDCFLDGSMMAGTFTTLEDKTFMATDSSYVPVGGETCNLSPPYTNCSNALSEMSSYHLSFLNHDFYNVVINGWEAGGCLEEMSRLIGYRYVLVNATVTGTFSPGGGVTVAFWVANQGYGRILNPRAAYLKIFSNVTYSVQVEADVRSWAPQSMTKVRVYFVLPPAMPTGSYSLALWLPDPSSQLRNDPLSAIQFGNVGVWDPRAGYNVLSTAFVVS